MSFSLFPKEVKFFDLFKDQNRKLLKAAKNLEKLFKEFDGVEEHCKCINIIEADANSISRAIAKELSSTFITPLDREDIHEINITQEAILNLIKAVSTRIGVYDISGIKYPCKRLVENLRTMIEEAGIVLDKLSKAKTAESELEKIKALKYDCEMLVLVGLGEIYDTHQGNQAEILDIMKWTHIYDRIEQAIDRTEALADIFEGILLKNA